MPHLVCGVVPIELGRDGPIAPGLVALNLLLTVLSIGAPMWFGWLATKQIRERFKLAEDYAFNASVSRAYEGYRKEAARIYKDMEARLLASALARLDEQPLRFVGHESHGSPWHELANSPVIQKAIKLMPDFADSITMHAKEAAKDAVDALKSTRPGTKESSKQPTKEVAEDAK